MATQGAPAGWLEDFFAQGNTDIGVVLVHGFTGSPASMRPWAAHLHEQGFTVSVPRLPGHGTQWQDLNSVSWQEWPERVIKEVNKLKESCRKVFICGLSMGGGTTLNVAEHVSVDGIILVNPMIHIPGVAIKFSPIIAKLKKGLPSVGDDVKAPGVTEWGYDVLPTRGVLQLNKLLKNTRANLSLVSAPTLLFHSVEDHVLPISNSDIIMSEIGSQSKQRIELTNSYHVATIDFDAPTIFENADRHIREWSK